MTKRKLFFWRARVALTACLILFFSVNSAFAGRRGKRCRPACPPPSCCAPCLPVETCGGCSPCAPGAAVEMHGSDEIDSSKPSVGMPTPAEPMDDETPAPLPPEEPAPPSEPAPLNDPDTAPPLPPEFPADPAPAVDSVPDFEPTADDDAPAVDEPAIDEPAANEPELDEPPVNEPEFEEPPAEDVPANEVPPPPEDDPFGLGPALDEPAVDSVDEPAADPAENDPFALPPDDEADTLELPADEPAEEEEPAADPAEDDPFGAYRPRESEPSLRVWTDVSGEHQVTAQLFERLDGKVRLLKTNGRFSTVSLEKLSLADREYLAETAIAARDWARLVGR